MTHLCSLGGLLKVFKKQSPNPYRTQSSSAAPLALPEGICREFSIAEIRAATNNFHPASVIAEGVFGPVYRGTIDGGSVVVAIKCHNGKLPKKMFRNETRLLCQLRHPNLVSLIGICDEQNRMFVVYEYMSRGSLGHHLHFKDYAPLAWEYRLRICIGAARGLHYLHTGAKYAVIHRNIKSFNIHLDDEWSCKLTDFGLSKMGPPSMSNTAIRKIPSRIIGTYVAPEYILHGELTEKCDVYSFGVVLFEVLCGTSACDSRFSKHELYLLDWAIKLGREGSIYDIIDPYLRGRIAPECFKTYLEIACSCIQFEGNQRPAMGEVEIMLELALELQKKADSGTNPHGERMYEEAPIPSSVFDFDYWFPN